MRARVRSGGGGGRDVGCVVLSQAADHVSQKRK